MRSILVTGGAGYIGSHTAKVLASSGFLPVVFDNLSQGYRSAVKFGPLVEGDLADTALLRKTLKDHRIEAVIHFAAHAYVHESVQAPRKYFQNNVANSLNLLDTMLKAGVNHIVFSSTCATYGVPASVPITESHPQVPVNPYGDSKLFVEKTLRWYGGPYGLKSVALRYFNAAGADPDGELGEDHDPETHLIPLAIKAALGTHPCLQVFGTDYPTPDGTAIRDYIHVADLGDAHVLALRYLLAGGATAAFNLGTGKGHSVREVIRTVERVSGLPVPVLEGPRRPGDPPVLVADAWTAGKILKWRPKRTELSEIIESAWAWQWKRRQLVARAAG